ncbi:fumarylacetoacetate hydrolase family protein [Alcaligenaceae bacterium]|nr:fumarylacetoacetate hydrolase family protein [Alcaligenaceae bacterium]
MEASTIAERLIIEHEEGKPFNTLDGMADIRSAYEVQKHFVNGTLGNDRVAGYKIGLTSKKMQAMCGIDDPIAGVVFNRRIHGNGARLIVGEYGHLGLEFEICVRLKADLPPGGAPYTRQSVRDAVDAVCPAIELIDDRNADYAQLDVKTLVADNAWNAGVVLGEFVPPPASLETVQAVVHRGTEELGRGVGADALGHPLAPLAWLANHLAQQGGHLRKGDIIMTGSLVRTFFPEPGSSFSFEIAGLGGVAIETA